MAEAAPTGSSGPLGAEGSQRRFGPGLTRARVRILGWSVMLVAGAIVAGIVLEREVLLRNLDREFDDRMRAQLDELETVAAEVDPQTGEPYTSVRRLFDEVLDVSVPLDGELILTFVDGEPYGSTRAARALLDDAALFASLRTATATTSGRMETIEGEVRYIARPASIEGAGGRQGVFVSAIYTEGEREEIDDVVRVAATVAFAVLLATSVAAWFVAGRVLRPVREVTEAARTITETDLRRRIEVRGDDEVAELAYTFNGMLDRLSAAFDAQRALVNDAGHELRTPITVIQGHLELLGDEPQDRAATMELVQGELDRMRRIVDDLLVLARAEQADFLRLGVVDLTTLVDDVIARARSLDSRSWLAVESDGDLLVVADRDRLMQAMLNLVENAARHTPDGSPVHVGVSRNARGETRLWVSDSGPGVAEADRARIFDRFSQGDRRAGSDDERAGAGLGLAIVSAIASAHGGRVELDTGPGAGARFTIVLPAETVAR